MSYMVNAHLNPAVDRQVLARMQSFAIRLQQRVRVSPTRDADPDRLHARHASAYVLDLGINSGFVAHGGKSPQ